MKPPKNPPMTPKGIRKIVDDAVAGGANRAELEHHLNVMIRHCGSIEKLAEVWNYGNALIDFQEARQPPVVTWNLKQDGEGP